METFDDTRALFAQLSATSDPKAVKTLIENHDAWTHNYVVESFAVAWSRLNALPKDAPTRARITQQRQALAPLVTRLPSAYATAV